jgi:hypothetical protein
MDLFEELKYLSCGNWDTVRCPQRNSHMMRKTYITESEPEQDGESPDLEALNNLCSACSEFFLEY